MNINISKKENGWGVVVCSDPIKDNMGLIRYQSVKEFVFEDYKDMINKLNDIVSQDAEKEKVL